jgi:hypothetical protein
MATLAGASIDYMTGPIAIPMAATIGVILLLHSIFDIILMAIAPVSAGIQQRRASTPVDRPATNHTSLAYSTLRFTRAADGGGDVSANTPVPGCR